MRVCVHIQMYFDAELTVTHRVPEVGEVSGCRESVRPVVAGTRYHEHATANLGVCVCVLG